MNKQELLNLSQDDLQNQLLEEKNPDTIKDIIDVMNLHLKKKEIIRASVLANTQDKIVDQITKRVDKPDNFSNKDLIEYYRTVEDNLTKKPIENIEVPRIQVNQQFNLNNSPTNNDDELDINSRQRILLAVNAILKKSKEITEEENDNVVEGTCIDQVVEDNATEDTNRGEEKTNNG